MSEKIYELITNRVIEKLNEGSVPWRKPWAGGSSCPKNYVSKREYNGINVFMLGMMRFSSPYWLTFKQAVDCGGSVRKGEKGTPVVFWKWLEVKNKDGEKDEIPFLRYYTVFNTEQIDGLEVAALPEPGNDLEPIAACEKIVSEMPDAPAIKHGYGQAYYALNLDYVGMPNLSQFTGSEEYYSTLFHELVHSTGHKSRLARKGFDGSAPFGSPDYSKEELIAEMGAAFLCGITGIENVTLDNSAAYIRSWVKRLKDDKKLVITAAAAASKAADFIQGKERVAAAPAAIVAAPAVVPEPVTQGSLF